jgi:hypothetical protein
MERRSFVFLLDAAALIVVALGRRSLVLALRKGLSAAILAIRKKRVKYAGIATLKLSKGVVFSLVLVIL